MSGGWRNREKAAFIPKLGAVNCERGDLWRGEWRAPSPPRLLMVSSQRHSDLEDNMAATDRNLLLEWRIKASEPDRNLLSNIQTVDANRKSVNLFDLVQKTVGMCNSLSTTMKNTHKEA